MTVARVRAAIASAALVALAFTQAPGLVVGDTKTDLVLDPGHFLRRALTAWDPGQAFGQLSNQSYGYLWPMGPFFRLGSAAGLPAWVVQRAWWALLLVVAFSGAYRLAGALGIGTPDTRLVAALAYALSPRVLSVLGAISVEAWPGAVLPWVILPLVRVASPRRAAALSGLAVACLGGVNAAATLAVLPLPALYLLARRRRLLLWWVPAVALATLWWVLPLLVLGRYGYPFLGLIEDAGVTTQVTTVTNTLRGAEHWLGYLVVHGAPRWPAGFSLAVDPLPVAATAAVAALGLAGLLLPGGPHRRWLLGGVLLGTVLIAAGHAGTLASPLAPAVRDLLDGPLAPLRNVHKLDPVLRLPLALGLAALLARVRPPRPRAYALAAVAALLAATLSPAWSGRVAPSGAYAGTPAYWRAVAGWLAQRPGRALLVPSANFADYRWGSPRDEPLQALARSDWAVRDAVPLGAPGATRLLDGLDARLGTGQPSSAYAPVLARAGVRWVVLRNDVDPVRSGAQRPGLVRAALLRSPGLRRVATFGPAQPVPYGPLDTVLGPASKPAAVEVFAVSGPPPGPIVYPRAGAVALAGGPEAVLELADAGLLDGRAVLAAGGAAVTAGGAAGVTAGGAAGVVTDTRRRRALNPGADPDRRYSQTLPAGADTVRTDIAATPPDGQSTEVLDGAAAVTASSSAADPYALAYRGPDRRPQAAVDRDPATAWVSDLGTAGEWLQLTLPATASPRTASVALLDDPAVGPPVTSVRVSTDAGTADAPVSDGVARVVLPPGPTRTVRLTVTGVSGDPRSGSVGVRELTVEGVRVDAAVAVPAAGRALTAGRPWAVLTERPDGARPDCARADAGWLCVPGLAGAGEETGPLSRRFATAAAGPVDVAARVRPRAGPGLDALLDAALGYRATGSSAIVTSPAARPGAAYDGDPETTWLPVDSDPAPQLRLDLGSTVTLTGLRLTGSARDYAGVARVLLSTPAGSRTLQAVPGRSQVFAPLRAGSAVLTFQRAGRADEPPARLRVPDVTLFGAPARAAGPVAVSCADGPAVGLDGVVRRFAVRASPAGLLALGPVAATPCGGPVPLSAGEHRLTTSRTGAFDVGSVAVRSAAPIPAVPAGRAVTVERDTAQARTLRVAGGDAGYLALAEGFNAGWTATAGGRTLDPVELDGWRQGWMLPAGDTTVVELTFTPGRAHRLGLLLGLLAALTLLPLALTRARPSPPAPPAVREEPARVPAPSARFRAAPAAVVGGLLGGAAGVVIGVAAGFVPGRWRPAAAGGALAAAGLVLGLAPNWPAQPAVTQLLALAAAGLAAAAWAAAGEPVGERQRGPLEDHPGQRRDTDRAEHREHRDREHAPAEGGPPGQ